VANINAYGLVIGVAAYEHVQPLPDSVTNDARSVAGLLADPAHCAYRDVQLLVDDSATLSGFRNALKQLAKQCDSDSVALVYFSGHGGRIPTGKNAGEYLLPVDARHTSPQALAKTAISGEEFTKALRTLPARKVVVLFDSCHAGGVGEPKTAGETIFKAGLTSDYYEALRAGTGRAILASCRDTELSWVNRGAANSIFTTHLLAGLRGGAVCNNGLISIFDLFEYLQPRVTAEQPNQHPIFKSNLEENFPVAMYLGGAKGAGRSDGFRYDVYICFVGPDAQYVWQTLAPALEQAGLKVAVSEDVEEAGVARVVGIERAIKQSKRIVVVLSENFLGDGWATFRESLAMTIGINEGNYRLLPVKIAEFDNSRLPERIRALVIRNLADPYRAEQQFKRLVEDLRGPLPLM
jgi:hypothetical protein